MAQKSKSMLWWLAGFFKPFRFAVYTVCYYLSSSMLQYKSIKSKLAESVGVQIYIFPLALLTQSNSIALVKLLFFSIGKSLLNTSCYMKKLRDKFNKCREIYNVYIYTFYLKNIYVENTLFFLQMYQVLITCLLVTALLHRVTERDMR